MTGRVGTTAARSLLRRGDPRTFDGFDRIVRCGNKQAPFKLIQLCNEHSHHGPHKANLLRST